MGRMRYIQPHVAICLTDPTPPLAENQRTNLYVGSMVYPCRDKSLHKGLNVPLTDDHIVLGVDVGSTTLKAVVVDPRSRAIVWSEYRRHETRLADTLLALLLDIGDAFADIPLAQVRVFITGSGAGPLCELVKCRNVVTLPGRTRESPTKMAFNRR